MKLYFLRHGIAEDQGPGGADAERRLTEEGTGEMRGVARGIRELDLDLDRILSSPLVRAQQTAEALHKGLAPAPQLQTCEELAPGGKAKKLVQLTVVRKNEETHKVGPYTLPEPLVWDDAFDGSEEIPMSRSSPLSIPLGPFGTRMLRFA